MMWSQKANRCVGNSPGAFGDVTDKGTSAIVLTGDTDPGSSTGTIHIAQASPGAIGSTALQPIDMRYSQHPSFPEGWMSSQKHGKPVVGDFIGLGTPASALVGASPDLFQMIVKDNNGLFSEPGGGMTIAGAPTEIRVKVIDSSTARRTSRRSRSKRPSRPSWGDFNGDGRADIALIGGPGWSVIPIAFSTTTGLGQFWGIAETDSGFNTYITQSANKPQFVSADFNGDGLSDLALVGTTQDGEPRLGLHRRGALGHQQQVRRRRLVRRAVVHAHGARGRRPFGLQHVRVGSRRPGGGRRPSMATASATSPSRAARAWTSIPVLFSRGGTGFMAFTMTNFSGGDNATFASKASQSGAKVVAGDFDGNGTSDLAVVGTAGNFIGLAMNARDARRHRDR